MENLLNHKKTKNILDFLETLTIALAFCALIYLTIAFPNKVEGQSMEPNFHHSDLVITNKTVTYLGDTQFGESRNYDFQRGDVVIVKQGNTDLIKRVIALEGEEVEIKENHVYVNGKELVEDYLPTTVRTKLPTQELSLIRDSKSVKVPANSYFVLGDNREHSKDSRFKEIGFISRSNIKGRVIFRYWPISDIGIVHRGEYK